MNKRLEKLITYMSELPAEANKHFDMGTFLDHRGKHLLAKAGSKIGKPHLLNCGTSACALGWAASIPSFQKAGLEMRFNGVSGSFYLNDERHAPYKIATLFFDIDRDVVYELFSSIGRCAQAKTPKEWARLAKKVIGA